MPDLKPPDLAGAFGPHAHPLPPAPRVSVIIPCYNYGAYLPDAVASVAAQTFSDFELILIDDGSTDGTAEVIAGLTDPRCRHRRTANRGVSAARNAGLDMARGEFIAFLDADDRWEPTKLARQVEVMDAEPGVALVFTDFRRFSHDGELNERQFDFVPELRTIRTRPARRGDARVVEGDAFVELGALATLPAWIQTDMFRASKVRDLRFSERLTLAEDLHYIMRAYTRGAAAFLPDALVEVRRHGDNSYRQPAEMLRPVIGALELLGRETFTGEERRILRVRISRAWRGLGYYHFWHGRAAVAAAAYLRASAVADGRADSLRHLLAVPVAPILRYLRSRG